MANLALIQEAAYPKQNIAFVWRHQIFRAHDDKPWHRFIAKVRKVVADLSYAIANAAMLVALLLFAAMAILVVIYTILFLVTFTLSLLEMV